MFANSLDLRRNFREEGVKKAMRSSLACRLMNNLEEQINALQRR